MSYPETVNCELHEGRNYALINFLLVLELPYSKHPDKFWEYKDRMKNNSDPQGTYILLEKILSHFEILNLMCKVEIIIYTFSYLTSAEHSAKHTIKAKEMFPK